MSNQPTNELTVDPADIGPDDLWLVWFRTAPILCDLGDPPVSTRWALSAPGPEGLRRLSEENAFGSELVAALPLTVMLAMKDFMCQKQSTGIVGWAQQALSLDKLMLVQDSQGATRIVSHAKELEPGETQLLTGNRKDLLAMAAEGEEILKQKDWRKVFSDHRPFVKHGEVGWLHFQRDPVGAEFLNDILERHRSEEHPA